ncbi:uncharacterized protein LOC144229106 isoform X2 [Crocuta crocuta]
MEKTQGLTSGSLDTGEESRHDKKGHQPKILTLVSGRTGIWTQALGLQRLGTKLVEHRDTSEGRAKSGWRQLHSWVTADRGKGSEQRHHLIRRVLESCWQSSTTFQTGAA